MTRRHYLSVEIVCFLLFTPETFVEWRQTAASAGELAWFAFPRINIDDFASQQTLHLRLEQTLAWAQFTYNYSQHLWCVDAERRDAGPGETIGGCWKSLSEAEAGILERSSHVQSDVHRNDR